MSMTLQGAKPLLEQKLYKAFYDAYMTQCDANSLESASKYDGETKSAFQKKADQFSKSLSKDMADAIYNFVKEIGIQANVSGVVIAPSGPCTGMIPMTNFTII